MDSRPHCDGAALTSKVTAKTSSTFFVFIKVIFSEVVNQSDQVKEPLLKNDNDESLD